MARAVNPIRNHRRGRRQVAEINVVPYIDVMLVLLVIFMITAPLLQTGVEIDLPDAAATPIEDAGEATEPLILSVDAEGDWFLNVGEDPDAPLAREEVQRLASAVLRYCKRLDLKGHRRSLQTLWCHTEVWRWISTQAGRLRRAMASNAAAVARQFYPFNWGSTMVQVFIASGTLVQYNSQCNYWVFPFLSRSHAACCPALRYPY